MKIKEALIHDLLMQVTSGKITFSRACELINEEAAKPVSKELTSAILSAGQEWISVKDVSINWPDCEVLGFDGINYMVGILGCETIGDVFVQDDLMKLCNITHYQLLTHP